LPDRTLAASNDRVIRRKCSSLLCTAICITHIKPKVKIFFRQIDPKERPPKKLENPRTKGIMMKPKVQTLWVRSSEIRIELKVLAASES